MNPLLQTLERIARVEFADIISYSQIENAKLRLFLANGGFLDVYASIKLQNRFSFHWETCDTLGTIYRYDAFPDPAWNHVATYPYHFHNGSQTNVESAPFSQDLTTGFREFLDFVRKKTIPQD